MSVFCLQCQQPLTCGGLQTRSGTLSDEGHVTTLTEQYECCTCGALVNIAVTLIRKSPLAPDELEARRNKVT